MRNILLCDKRAKFVKSFNYNGIGLKNVLARKFARVFGKDTFFVHGAENIYTPFKARVKVFLAVAGGNMHYTHARIHSNKIGMNYRVKFFV